MTTASGLRAGKRKGAHLFIELPKVQNSDLPDQEREIPSLGERDILKHRKSMVSKKKR